MTLMEPSLYGLWVGKQTAETTENTTPSKRLVQVGGDFNIARDDGSEPWSDLSKYGSQTDWINSLLGNGNPAIEATPSETAYLNWLMHGSETVTAGTNEVQSVIATGASSGSFTLTFTDATGSQTTGAIAFNAAASAVDTALEALTKIGAGNVTCAGGPLPGTAVTMTFTGTLAAQPIRALTADNTNLVGGSAVVTEPTPGVRNKHLVKPSLSIGHWCTFFRRMGVSVVDRHSFIDCLIFGMQIEASTANKAVRLTPTVFSKNPGRVKTADPAAVIPSQRAFLYSDATGTFTIDGVVIKAQSQYTFAVNEDRSPAYGDDVVPHNFAVGQPTATIGTTLLMDLIAQQEYNKLVYGTASPTVGTEPLRNLPALGSYSAYHKQKDNDGFLNGNDMKITIPGVKWAVPDSPNPAPGGGASEIALAGQMRTISGSDPYTIEVWNSDAAYTT